jgi:NitT/TauT family transport system substrate-binding protein
MTHRPLSRRDTFRLAAGSTALGLARPALAAAPQQAMLTLDWTPSGYHAPLFLGLQQGLFSKEGIDLTVVPGTGTHNTILAVAAGHTTFGSADASSLPAAAVQGAAVRMFCGYLLTTAFAIMYKNGAGIRVPKDIEGRSYGDSPSSATYGLWPAFMAKTGIDPATVRRVIVSPAATNSSFLAGQYDVTYTAVNGVFVHLRHSGYDLGTFEYADHGLGMMSIGFIANEDTLRNTDLVRRFVAGWRASLAAARADPALAAEVAKRANPASAPADEQVDMMKDTFTKRIVSRATTGKPPGWMALEDWALTVDLMKTYGGVSNPPAPDTYFTNDFVAA